MVAEQFLKKIHMESGISEPKHPLLVGLADKPDDERKHNLMAMIQEFMTHYGYGMVDCPEQIKRPSTETPKEVYLVKPDGQCIHL